jgi:hypothetical protein
MQIEEIVIHETFDDIERSPAGDHCGNQRRPLAIHSSSAAPTPQPQHTDQNREARAGVEHSVRNKVGAQTDIRPGGQQVMPTQQLVQDDAVHKRPKANTKKQSRA